MQHTTRENARQVTRPTAIVQRIGRQVLLLVLLLALLALPIRVSVRAQEATPAPASATEVPPIAEFDARLGAANAALDRALGVSSLFEALGVLIAVITAAAAAAAGIIGGIYVRNLNRSREQLELARKEVRRDVKRTRIRLETELKNTFGELQRELVNEQQRMDLQMAASQRALDDQRKQTTHGLMAQSLLALAEKQYRAGDFKGAIETHQSALRLDDNNPVIHYALGYVYVHSNVLDKAREHLEKALKLYPDLPQALAALGYTFRRIAERMDMGLERSEMLSRAEQHLIAALKISPRLIDDDGESWYGSLGGLYRRSGRVDEAIHAYEQAADVTPQSSYPFSNLALLYMEKKDRANMLAMYARVERLALTETQIDGSNYWAYSDLFTSRLALGNLADADTALETLFFTIPKDAPYALEVLADTLERLQEVLGDAQQGAYVLRYINRIRQQIGQMHPERLTGDM